MNTEIEKLRKEIEVLKRTLQPIGSIQCFAMLNVPDCWLPCDGRELMARMYPELYQKIGNVFGGVPNKTFCLPDLQGRFIRGWDKEWNLDSGRKFGSTQEDAFQGHGHQLKVNGEMESSGSHSHWVSFDERTISYGSQFLGRDSTMDFHIIISNSEYYDSSSDAEWKYGERKHELTDNCGSHFHKLPSISVLDAETTKFTPVRVSTETRPKNLALLYCIKVK